MVASIPVGQKSIREGGRNRGIHAQANDVGVRVGIPSGIAFILGPGCRSGIVVVRVVGVTVPAWMVVSMVLTHLVLMPDLDH
jgi:hypothetical protein